jgi:hypothetical protein
LLPVILYFSSQSGSWPQNRLLDVLPPGDAYDVAKWLGDEIATVERHEAPFVRELSERFPVLMEIGAGIHPIQNGNPANRIEESYRTTFGERFGGRRRISGTRRAPRSMKANVDSVACDQFGLFEVFTAIGHTFSV